MIDASTSSQHPEAADYVERAGGDTFDATVDDLVRRIEAAGLTIFARIDHAEAARSVGLDMPPTLVLVYGNPRGGTPIMLATPPAALDLPLKVLVRADAAGRTFVGFHPIAGVLRQAGVQPEVAQRLKGAQALLFKGDAS